MGEAFTVDFAMGVGFGMVTFLTVFGPYVVFRSFRLVADNG
jgi:hypothetical protein